MLGILMLKSVRFSILEEKTHNDNQYPRVPPREICGVMDEDSKFNHHTHAAVVGANQTLIIKQTIVTKIYKSLVTPILVYGMFFAMTINKTDQNAVESIQR